MMVQDEEVRRARMSDPDRGDPALDRRRAAPRPRADRATHPDAEIERPVGAPEAPKLPDAPGRGPEGREQPADRRRRPEGRGPGRGREGPEVEGRRPDDGPRRAGAAACSSAPPARRRSTAAPGGQDRPAELDDFGPEATAFAAGRRSSGRRWSAGRW